MEVPLKNSCNLFLTKKKKKSPLEIYLQLCSGYIRQCVFRWCFVDMRAWEQLQDEEHAIWSAQAVTDKNAALMKQLFLIIKEACMPLRHYLKSHTQSSTHTEQFSIMTAWEQLQDEEHATWSAHAVTNLSLHGTAVLNHKGSLHGNATPSENSYTVLHTH